MQQLRSWNVVPIQKSVCWMKSIFLEVAGATSWKRRRSGQRMRSNAGGEALEQRLLLFVLGPRWSVTATDGSGLSQGDPTTVTWSIVQDGTPIPKFTNIQSESSDPSNLVAFMRGIYDTQGNGSDYTGEVWFAHFQSAFDRWSELGGLNLVYVPYDDGVTFSGAASGVLNVRADIRIGGHYIDGNSNVLAYNFYPNNGEMVIDTGDGSYTNTRSDSIRLRNIVAHEAGHGIGIAHMESSDGAFLMEPFLQTHFFGPQFDDILALQRHYGDIYERNGGNDTAATATPLGVLSNGQTVSIGTNGGTLAVSPTQTDFVSIDNHTDIDFYSFTVNTAGNVSIQLTPKGPTYMMGPQGGTQSSFNASAQSDLTLALFGTNGSSQLVYANNTGLGGSESISDFYISQPGTYYVRVRGLTENRIQMYQLDVSHSAIAEIAGRHIFYNNAPGSLFDSSGAADAAIDPTKQALLPGQTTGFTNYTNYIKGLNGILVDIHNLPSTEISGSSFHFEVWDGISAEGWTVSSVLPSAISVLPGVGIEGSSRVRIEFPDYDPTNPEASLQNTWLKVTMLADAATGLPADDVFYFGNAIGEMNVGNIGSPLLLRVVASDTSVVRLNQSLGINSVDITNLYDLNKDGRVNAGDTSLVRLNQSPGVMRFFTADTAATVEADGSSDGNGLEGGSFHFLADTSDVTTRSWLTLDTARLSQPALLFGSSEFDGNQTVFTWQNSSATFPIAPGLTSGAAQQAIFVVAAPTDGLEQLWDGGNSSTSYMAMGRSEVTKPAVAQRTGISSGISLHHAAELVGDASITDVDLLSEVFSQLGTEVDEESLFTF